MTVTLYLGIGVMVAMTAIVMNANFQEYLPPATDMMMTIAVMSVLWPVVAILLAYEVVLLGRE